MRLLLVSYFYLFNESTGSLRARAMARYLPRLGVDVSVLTYRKQQEVLSYQENVIGVKNVTRDTSSPVFYFAWRLWHKGLRMIGVYRDPYIYWSVNALAHADEIVNYAKPEAVLASYPTITALDIGMMLAKRYNMPLISDFRDGLLFEPLEAAALQYDATRLHYEKMEARVVAASKLILTVSEPISAYFRERYAHPNVVTLPNGYDFDDIAADLDVELPTDVINIVHTGRLGISEENRGVDALRAALYKLLESETEIVKKIQLHFVGQLSTVEKDHLAPLIERGIVRLWGHQPRAKALGLQRKADVLLLITAPDKASIATGKIFEYLAANKPILALTRGTEAARIVNETGAGLVVSPDNPDEIAVAIRECIVPSGREFPTRNEALIATYSRFEQMKSLAMKLKEII